MPGLGMARNIPVYGYSILFCDSSDWQILFPYQTGTGNNLLFPFYFFYKRKHHFTGILPVFPFEEPQAL